MKSKTSFLRAVIRLILGCLLGWSVIRIAKGDWDLNAILGFSHKTALETFCAVSFFLVIGWIVYLLICGMYNSREQLSFSKSLADRIFAVYYSFWNIAVYLYVAGLWHAGGLSRTWLIIVMVVNATWFAFAWYFSPDLIGEADSGTRRFWVRYFGFTAPVIATATLLIMLRAFVAVPFLLVSAVLVIAIGIYYFIPGIYSKPVNAVNQT